MTLGVSLVFFDLGLTNDADWALTYVARVENFKCP